jgi:hypothetical protein
MHSFPISVPHDIQIWRLFYAWQWSRLMVLFPFLTLLGSIGCMVGYTVVHNSEPPHSVLVPSPNEFRLTVGFFACSFFTTLYTTSTFCFLHRPAASNLVTAFVIYKLFQLDKQDNINLRHEETTRWVGHVLIESDALYTVTLGVYLILHIINNSGEQLLAAWVRTASS